MPKYTLWTAAFTLLSFGVIAACSHTRPQVMRTRRVSAPVVVVTRHRARKTLPGRQHPSRKIRVTQADQHRKRAVRHEAPAVSRRTGVSGAHSLTIAVISDLNGRYGSKKYSRRVHRAIRWITHTLKPDIVLSVGDMVAGQRHGLDYVGMWRAFHGAVTTPLARAGIPLAVTPGNHDASAGRGFENERRIYVRQWMAHKPRLHYVDDAHYPLRYAFVMGPALFVSLDDTMTGHISRRQRAWVARVLRRYRRMPLKIVWGHVPLYPVAAGMKREILDDARFERLLKRYGVNLLITGHHQAYFPGRRGRLRMLAMGCLGSGPRALVGHKTRSHRSAVVIRIRDDRIRSIQAYYGSHMRHRVRRRDLPRYLNDGRWRIWRDDLRAPAGTVLRARRTEKPASALAN